MSPRWVQKVETNTDDVFTPVCQSFCSGGSPCDVTSCLAAWSHVPSRGVSVSGPMLFPGGSLSLVPCSFQGGLFLWSHVPSRGVSFYGPMFLPGGLCLWSHVPSRGVSFSGPMFLSQGLPDRDPPGQTPPRERPQPPGQRPPCTVKSGWYTSYWSTGVLF